MCVLAAGVQAAYAVMLAMPACGIMIEGPAGKVEGGPCRAAAGAELDVRGADRRRASARGLDKRRTERG